MLAHLEQVARGHGRTVLDAEADWPYDGRPTARARRSPTSCSGAASGSASATCTACSTCPSTTGCSTRLAAEAAPHHAAYTIRSWVGPVPDDLVVSFAELVATLMVEAPTGDLEREPETADVDALRRAEELIEKQGRTMYTSVALDGSGGLVAYSNLVTLVHDPDNAFQWGTLVRRADRGHRLGLAVKVATLRLLHQGEVPARRLHTWNAEVNEHMIGINERLGFRPVERVGEFQKTLV